MPSIIDHLRRIGSRFRIRAPRMFYTVAVMINGRETPGSIERWLGPPSNRAVLLLAALVFFWFLGAHDLWAPDEPFFGEGAREMLVDGQWLVTHVNGVVNSHKPPLFFWLIALFSVPLGAVTEFTARLPSVLAALGTVVLVMRLGRRWFGPGTAAVAGLLLTTSYMFWDKARWSQIDSLLCFLIWVALSAFEAWRAGDADGRRAGLVFWTAAGLAVLAKGPVGMLLPLGIAVVVLAVERDLGGFRRFAPVAGPMAFATVTGAWAVAATLWGPADYSVVGALREHFLERGMHGMHHVRPFWYYAERLPLSLLPWTGLLPGALVLAWKQRRKTAGLRFSFVAAVFVVVFFSISTEKRDLYVLPAFPAIALMTAALVARVADWRGEVDDLPQMDRRWVTIGQGIVGGLFGMVALAVPLVHDRVEYLPSWMVYLLGGVLLATGAATVVSALRGRALSSVAATVAGMSVLYLAATALVYPAMEPRKSSRAFALEIKEITADSRASGHDVVAWRAGNIPVAVAFYSDGVYTIDTNDAEVLADHLRQDALVYAVVLTSDLGEVPGDAIEGMEVHAERRLSRRDLALISNRRVE
jgi:4-amino-4-deoxy-L-arabinose transferase-like glycosyltransferase